MTHQTTSRSASSDATPRLSIGLPVYNAEAFLEVALDSLLAQTFTDFELIISDNASTDRTPAICRAYAQRDSRIRCEYQNENRGANWNFNRVCELAQANLFKWAAADDLLDPTFVERCVAVLDRNPAIIACHSRTVEIDTHGDRLGNYNPAGPRELATSPKAHRRFADVLLNHGWGTRCFGIFRRRKLMRTGLFTDDYGWEKVLMADLALTGRFHLIDQVLFYDRVHADSLSHQVMHGGGSSKRSALADHYRSGRTLPRLQYIKGYLGLARRRAPDWKTTLACVGWITVYLLQVRKLAGMLQSKLPHWPGKREREPAAKPTPQSS